MNKDELILVFDMDGNVANFRGAIGDIPESEVDNAYKRPLFFRNLEPFPNLDKIGKLPNPKYILTAIPRDMEYAKQEKIDWVKEHMPFIKEENILFSYKDEKKTEVFKNTTGLTSLENTVLFDDFKRNLLEWKEEGGFTVKKRTSSKGAGEYSAILKDFALIDFCLQEIISK